LFIDRINVRGTRFPISALLLIVLSLQVPICGRFATGVDASISSPLDNTQPPPKVFLTPGSSNETMRPADAAIGPQSVIVILVEFTNLNHSHSASDINKVFFEDVNRYYQDISYGMTSLVGKTVGWYRLNYTLSYYGRDGLVVDDPNFDGGIDSWWMLRDAIKAADSDVDFSAYDHVVIIHAGNGEESSKVPDDVWSVAYSGLWLRTQDSESVHNGVVVPESEAMEAVTLGVYAHEFAHLLGLPDLYAYGSQKSYVGDWGLMDHGLWNGEPKGSSPAHPMAYSKMKLGWIPSSRVMTVEASMNVTANLIPTESNTDGYRVIKIPVKNLEYYLVEVRQKTGYDAYLPSDGVLISYVNERLGSGYGRVRIVDSHTLTSTLDDAVFDVGRVFSDSVGKFSVRILSSGGGSYLINVDRSGPAPDIVIKDFRLEPAAPRTNETITILADVENQGTTQASNFYVNCYIDDILYTKSRLTLSAGRTTTIKVEWKATGGSHNIQFIVDPASLAVESNRNNNVLSRNIAVGLLLKLHMPKDVQVTVNGTVYSSGQNNEVTLGVLPGTQNIEVANIQSLGNDTRFVFVRWSDGNTSNTRTITVGSDVELSAEYKKQYDVKVSGSGGSISGEGWYDEGSTANIVANSPCNEVQKVSRTLFTQWSGDSTSDSATVSITVDSPYSFTANWKNQYFLLVDSSYGSITGSGWYDANTIATFSITPTSEIGNDTRRYFTGWTGDLASTQSSITMTIDSAKSVSATWRTQYLLTVVSPYGDPNGGDWYDSGALVNVSVRNLVDHGNGTRRVFKAWTGDTSATSSSTSITMDGPKEAFAQWATQYKLSITTSGVPQGALINITIDSVVVNRTTPFTYSDWYDAETIVELNATKQIKSGFKTYVFNHWTNSSGAKISNIVTAEAPDTLTAVYAESFGCIIATATFESELSPEVQLLRNFRDARIMTTFAGSNFMTVFNTWYYSFSPFVASTIAHNQVLRAIARVTLYPLIAIMHITALTYNTLEYSPEMAVVAAGFTASCMIGTVYFAPLLATVLAIGRRRRISPRATNLLACLLMGSCVTLGISGALQLSTLMMIGSSLFVLTTIALSASLSVLSVSWISRKLNWNRMRLLQLWPQ